MSGLSQSSRSAFISIYHNTPINCLHCGSDAYLIRIMPAGEGVDQRTFECEACKQEQNVMVKV